MLSAGYAALVLLTLALVRGLGERWWPATALLFGPRWLWLLPMTILLPLALRRRRWRAVGIQAATLALILGPWMGFQVPWSRFGTAPAGRVLRVMTFNRSVGAVDLAEFVRTLDRERVDLICFQEGGPDQGIDDALRRLGWQLGSQDKVASRLPIVRELDASELPWHEYGLWPVRLHRVVLRTEEGREFLLASVHMPTMGHAFGKLRGGDLPGFRRYVDWRWEQMARLVEKLGETADLPTLIGGDFNMPPDSPMLAAIEPLYRPGFAEAGLGYGYTRPVGLPWIQIDHILAGPEWRFRRCWVGPDLGSDHRPLLAEVVLVGPP